MASESAADARLPQGITRDVLENDGVRTALRMHHPEVPLLSEAELAASLDATLRARADGGELDAPVWLFAYGSLLWNPCVTVTGQCLARLHGYHRDFRLRLDYGRGSPECPGLMLGLTAGGSCRGAAIRVGGSHPRRELHLVWRRELLTGVYRPRWVRLAGPDGPLHAIAFVVDTSHPCYQGRIDEAGIVEYLATGHGLLGSCAEYLDNTVEALDARGIHDRRLHRLRRALDAARAAAADAPGTAPLSVTTGAARRS